MEVFSDTEPITKKDLMASLMECFAVCNLAKKSDLTTITEMLEKHNERMDWLEDRQDKTIERVEDVENEVKQLERDLEAIM